MLISGREHEQTEAGDQVRMDSAGPQRPLGLSYTHPPGPGRKIRIPTGTGGHRKQPIRVIISSVQKALLRV